MEFVSNVVVTINTITSFAYYKTANKITSMSKNTVEKVWELSNLNYINQSIYM